MPSAKNTTMLLKQLRGLMQNTKYVPEPLNAYIISSADAHNSEYLAECDQRRDFISGFTGSAGVAVVTENKALMWTDGRYFLQAEKEMDGNWDLMKEGASSTPGIGLWLAKNLPAESRIGFDPYLMSISRLTPIKTQLDTVGYKLIPIQSNLIDAIWNDKPQTPCNPIKPLGLQFTGKSIGEKFEVVKRNMKEKNASALVLTALDEVAYFLNMRGSDIPYNPVFFAYIIIQPTHFTLYIDPSRVTPEVKEHLENEIGSAQFKLMDYKEIESGLKSVIETTNGFIWLSESANFALTIKVPQQRLLTEITPICLMKAIKNPVEIEGLRNAHIRDGVALCSYFAWLEEALANNETVTEVSGADKLEQFRAKQENFVGLSFATISSVGSNGAIIHYHPTNETDVPIRADQIYLCDSGGQYFDGTTDVTRTFHFGTPTEKEKECYTMVLKGQIQLATMVFPSKIKGNTLDGFARQFLWSLGLDYIHGTGHGIGSYLNVHEGPMGISYKNLPDDPGLEAGMFLSNEPGYYEEGKFGIRLEDIVQIVPANTKYKFDNRDFLTFETITYCPKQTKLINVNLLTEDEIKYINDYHQQCRKVLGPLLEKQNEFRTKQWLWKETEPITK